MEIEQIQGMSLFVDERTSREIRTLSSAIDKSWVSCSSFDIKILRDIAGKYFQIRNNFSLAFFSVQRRFYLHFCFSRCGFWTERLTIEFPFSFATRFLHFLRSSSSEQLSFDLLPRNFTLSTPSRGRLKRKTRTTSSRSWKSSKTTMIGSSASPRFRPCPWKPRRSRSC